MADTDTTDTDHRRAARRHLSKWAKIMCQIVGLERVAEELMGRRTWTSYQDVMLGQETKTGEALCPAPVRPSSISLTRENSRSPMAGGWYLRPVSPEPQPLDLSAKPPKPPLSPNKTIFKAKPRLTAVGGRRSYTEDELQAALRDIQSGKLGTRRAAVIYGIPRSTLRNKVYKISQENRDYDEREDEEDELSAAEEERETEQILNRPLLSVEDVIRLTSEVRAWPCLQQLLGGGASTSSTPTATPSEAAIRQPKNGEDTVTIPKDQPLDFRRDIRNHSINNNNNNHLEEKKSPPVTSGANTAGATSKTQQGGKGTRPKRGKYRNYDRDSLVEAVRAVQRGEMSVHRAGSYYGVPHSTLEYKVKERHLMRPRKREPKPQPPVGSVVAEDKRKEEEKRIQPPRTPQLTPPLTNGLKLPFLDPALAYRQAPFPYWQAPFPLALEYGRPELFAPSPQLVPRRLTSPQEEGPPPIPLSKSAREIAESLLETSPENGSFLDGIIRSSLDTGLPKRETGKVLLEQLCRSGQISNEKRSESPPPSVAPPAERTPSPTTSSSNTNSNANNNSSNSNNSNVNETC